MRRTAYKSLFLFVVLLVLLWRPVRQALAVAAVQKCVGADRLIFRSPDYSGTKGTLPSGLSPSVESAFKQSLTKFFRVSPGSMPLYEQRFVSLFSDSIENILLEVPYTGELGAALARFPRLREVTIREKRWGGEVDWIKLCAGLRQCRRLEEINFSGAYLTDSSVAPLAGHPTLRIAHLGGHFTPACIETFKSMPALVELTFASVGAHLLEAERVAIQVALPSVKVQFLSFQDFRPTSPSVNNR